MSKTDFFPSFQPRCGTMPFFLICEAAILTYPVSHLNVYLSSAFPTDSVPMLLPISILILLASYVAANITIYSKDGKLQPYPQT
jgi:hypothetical protein